MVYLDSVQMQEHLPQRYPFLFIDAIKSYDPEVPAIVAIKNVSNNDPILQGHFPGNPILPGVVMIEAMAQAAVVLGSLKGLYDPDKQNCYFLKIDEAKFRQASVPGESLDVYVKALRVGRSLRKAMKRYGPPDRVVTYKLPSYRAALRELGIACRQETGRWLNNRAENSHQPLRRREKTMTRFRSMRSLQKFAAIQSSIHNHFNLERHFHRREEFKENRTQALAEWRQLAA